LVEHATENRSVGGSIPPLGTIISSEIKILDTVKSEAKRPFTSGGALGTQKVNLPPAHSAANPCPLKAETGVRFP
jgi:hypothetical protein